ncbi:hypothetical protein WDW89_23225 [Deltaproteobacteria bacterium TL4]
MMDKDKLLKLLKAKIEAVDQLIDNNSEDLKQWREETLMLLDSLIGEDSKYYQNFEKIRYTSAVVAIGDDQFNEERHAEARIKGLEETRAILKAIEFGIENGIL